LAGKPLCRWVSGHRNPQQLPPSMAENKKREQLLKGNRRNHKEINRRNPLHDFSSCAVRLRGSIANGCKGICIAPRGDGQTIGIMVKLKKNNESASALVLRVLAPQNKSL
jgi:hypothetical protein